MSAPSITMRPGGRLDQPVQQAHQRRLARARQAHDHEDLAGLDLEGGIEHADRLARLREDFLLRKTLADEFEGFVGRIAEHLEDMVDENSFGHMPGLLVERLDTAPSPAKHRTATVTPSADGAVRTQSA
jgi:hypothetical protein